jgi:hypothetical protein
LHIWNFHSTTWSGFLPAFETAKTVSYVSCILQNHFQNKLVRTRQETRSSVSHQLSVGGKQQIASRLFASSAKVKAFGFSAKRKSQILVFLAPDSISLRNHIRDTSTWRVFGWVLETTGDGHEG